MKYFAFSFHCSRSRSVQNGPCSSFWGLSLLSARVASLELSLETFWGWDHCKAHGYQGPHLHQNPQGQANWISQKLLGILISSHPDCLVSNGLWILPLTKLLSQVHPLGKQFHRGGDSLYWNGTHAMSGRCLRPITALHDEKLGDCMHLSLTNSGLWIFPFISKTYSLTNAMRPVEFILTSSRTAGSPEGVLLWGCFIFQPV